MVAEVLFLPREPIGLELQNCKYAKKEKKKKNNKKKEEEGEEV